VSIPTPPTPAGRRAAGRALRKVTPRAALAGFTPPARRFDPLTVLAAHDKVRIAELVPIRYGRMSVSPFTFLRGPAAVMARDIAGQPTTGIRVHCCGDCHLLNFGTYGTPERNLVFDVNDFDETLEAPFEWHTKRLAASIHVAAQDNGFSATEARTAVLAAMSTYRTRMDQWATMTNLDVWYDRVDMARIEALIADPKRRKIFSTDVGKNEERGNLQALMKLGTETKGGHVRIKDHLPLVRHVALERPVDETVEIVSARYRETPSGDRKRPFDRYVCADTAREVVGVGSVGTDARIALVLGRDTDDPLFLQMKEARAAVLAPYAGASPCRHQGQRVVEGQRLMQAASDIFLGW